MHVQRKCVKHPISVDETSPRLEFKCKLLRLKKKLDVPRISVSKLSLIAEHADFNISFHTNNVDTVGVKTGLR